MASQLAGNQIKDGAITNAKVAAGAAIATSKLADGSLFIKEDGSNPFTTDQSMGNNKLTNLATATNANDAVPLTQVESLISALQNMFDAKESVRAASTANVTVSNPGTSSFDGVTLSSGQRLLLRAQSTAAQNGIYIFNGSGSALTRSADMDAWSEVVGALIIVEEGTTYADYVFLSTANQGGTLGSTSITFSQVNAAGLSSANFVENEVPSGTVNGSNTAFTIANTPTAGSERLFRNGMRQKSGGEDYTISGAAITMIAAPETGDILLVDYRK